MLSPHGRKPTERLTTLTPEFSPSTLRKSRVPAFNHCACHRLYSFKTHLNRAAREARDKFSHAHIHSRRYHYDCSQNAAEPGSTLGIPFDVPRQQFLNSFD